MTTEYRTPHDGSYRRPGSLRRARVRLLQEREVLGNSLLGCPLHEDARQQLLGCQLEQSLLAEDCGRVGDSVGEAQHGQAAGHIGIFLALLAILR